MGTVRRGAAGVSPVSASLKRKSRIENVRFDEVSPLFHIVLLFEFLDHLPHNVADIPAMLQRPF
jgi:hypothetical protein